MSKVFEPKLFSLIKNGMTKKQITTDIISGIVVAVVALPLAIAFAVASGVSPERGIITSIVAGAIISLLGGSRVQIGGPTGAFIVIVFGIVEEYGINGLIISTIMAGIILIIFGYLRLGNLLKYFPNSLITGFTSGIALIIFSTQIKDALGLNIAKVPGSFIGKWKAYFDHITEINIDAVLISVFTILIIIFSKKFIKKIPGSFISIIIMTSAVAIFNLPVETIESSFGNIPTHFSFQIPNFSLKDFEIYIGPAITIALLGSIESLLSAVVSDGMIGGNHRSNTELIAQGVANIVSPFFGGIPATGAIARTATNVNLGGRTPISGIVHSFTLLLIMLIFGKWAKLIPLSCLAGVLIVVAYNMSEWRAFKNMVKGSKFDSIVLLSTFILTVLVDLTVAIQVGVVLSALLFMKRMGDINGYLDFEVDSDLIEDYSDIPKEISIYEISGPLFFASVKEYSRIIKKMGITKKVLIIRMRHVPFIDSTGLDTFKNTLKELKKNGVKIVLSGVNESVLKELKSDGIDELIEKFNIKNSFEEAIVDSKKILSANNKDL